MREKGCGRVDDHAGHEWRGRGELDDPPRSSAAPSSVTYWCKGPPVRGGGEKGHMK